MSTHEQIHDIPWKLVGNVLGIVLCGIGILIWMGLWIKAWWRRRPVHQPYYPPPPPGYPGYPAPQQQGYPPPPPGYPPGYPQDQTYRRH